METEHKPCFALWHRQCQSCARTERHSEYRPKYFCDEAASRNDADEDADLELFHKITSEDPSRDNSQLSSAPIYKAPAANGNRSRGRLVDDLLSGDREKNDYDWLMTPPGSPQFSETRSQSSGLRRGSTITSITPPVATIRSSKLVHSLSEPPLRAKRTGFTARQALSGLNGSLSTTSVRSLTFNSSSTTTMSSRSVTPTRSSVSARSPTLTRQAVAATSRSPTPTRSTAAASSRPSTPTRSTAPGPVRSSTPTRLTVAAPGPSRSLSSTARTTVVPTSKTTAPVMPKSVSRPSTPTRRPSTPTRTPNSYCPSVCSSASKISSIPSRAPSSSRPSSPSARPVSIPPGFSDDTPPNLRTTMPERPPSVTRGRPSTPSSSQNPSEKPERSASVTRGRPRTPVSSQNVSDALGANVRGRRLSCSPSAPRGRSATDSFFNDRSIRLNKSYISEAVAPIGNRGGDRVLNARSVRNVQEDQITSKSVGPSSYSRRSVKPSAADSSGFGLTISKKSLDMALRHMDIGQNSPNGVRSLAMPHSSLHSVRSASSKIRPTNLFDSPLGSRSNGSSSDQSSMNLPFLEDNSHDGDDDDFSVDLQKKITQASNRGSILLREKTQCTNWLHSNDDEDFPIDTEKRIDQMSQNGSLIQKEKLRGTEWLHKPHNKVEKMENKVENMDQSCSINHCSTDLFDSSHNFRDLPSYE